VQAARANWPELVRAHKRSAEPRPACLPLPRAEGLAPKILGVVSHCNINEMQDAPQIAGNIGTEVVALTEALADAVNLLAHLIDNIGRQIGIRNATQLVANRLHVAAVPRMACTKSGICYLVISIRNSSLSDESHTYKFKH
jgi:hypothetical protein